MFSLPGVILHLIVYTHTHTESNTHTHTHTINTTHREGGREIEKTDETNDINLFKFKCLWLLQRKED